MNGGIPYLDIADFLRLIRSGAIGLISRKKGLVDTGDRLMSGLGLGVLWPEFHERMLDFFGLSLGFMEEPGDLAATESYAQMLFEAWSASDQKIVFATSGSTGKALNHTHSRAMIMQEAQVTKSLFPTCDRVLVSVSLLHSYGFIFGVLWPKLMGLPTLDLPPWPTSLEASWNKGDFVVSFPWLLSRVKFESDLVILTATSPCPEDLFKVAMEAGSSMWEIYGASETGAMAVRSAPGPFRLLSHWKRYGDSELARAIPEGHEEFEPWLHEVPDILEWIGDGLRPVGRKDRATQVAGVNVYPGRVAELIRQLPGVAHCLVRSCSEDGLERLKAYIVLKSGALEELVRKELNECFQQRLSPPERPGKITFGSELPRTVFGKESDWPD